MKDFLKNIFSSFVGVALFCGVAIAISLIGLLGMAVSAGSSVPEVKNGSVMVLKLGGVMQERNTEPSPLAMLLDDNDAAISLAESMASIKKAKESDKIKGIYILAQGVRADLAQAEELRNALSDFKKSGKWIIAYGDSYSTLDYYIASVADKIYLNPQGTVDWHGLGGKMFFLKDMLAKIGIRYEIFKCGKYKSATEIFSESHSSEASREQTERYLSLWWNAIKTAVASTRHIAVDSLDAYADRIVTYDEPEKFVSYKFVDKLAYEDQMSGIIKKELGLDDDDDDIPQTTVADFYASIDKDKDGGEIAVYYASGEIVDNEPQQNLLMNAQYIVGKDVCKDLRQLAKDDDVKAVVLRVNSPGGSAFASEQIWHAVVELRKVKPVVVSMSSYAASGGYYISSGANYIYADAGTITGSIGIFGYIPNASELSKKLGVNFESVKTNRNSDMGWSLYGYMPAPLTGEQSAIMQSAINRGYNVFKTRVSQGRGLSMAAVEERAQGHVFTGTDALKLKLVDGIGGIDKAVAKAAQLAKLEECHTKAYPKEKDYFTRLLDKDNSQGKYINEQLRLLLGEFYEPLMQAGSLQASHGIQAQLPYIIMWR